MGETKVIKGLMFLKEKLYNGIFQDRMKCIDLARHGLDRIFSEYELDLLVTPMFSGLAPVSGYPSICVPAGYCSDGTPYGITFIGRAYDEPRLIAAAYAYEQISRRRKQPVFAV